jgi:hypothetical protein
MAYCEVSERHGPKAPTAIHSPLDLKYQQIEEATKSEDGLENQLTPRDLWGENYKRRMEV